MSNKQNKANQKHLTLLNREDIEKLLLKKKSNNGFFPTIDKIPNKESIRYVIQPPVK